MPGGREERGGGSLEGEETLGGRKQAPQGAPASLRVTPAFLGPLSAGVDSAQEPTCEMGKLELLRRPSKIWLFLLTAPHPHPRNSGPEQSSREWGRE